MGAITNRYEYDPVEVKQWLRIDNDEEDKLLEMLFEAAKEAADTFINNDFYDEITGLDQPIPPSVKVGVLKTVAEWYEDRRSNLTHEGIPGGHSTTVGAAPQSALNLWSKYRLLPGL